jgi:hypothetical protein
MKTHAGVEVSSVLEQNGYHHAPAALLPGKSPRYPLYKRLRGSKSRSGRYKERNLFRQPRIEHRLIGYTDHN